MTTAIRSMSHSESIIERRLRDLCDQYQHMWTVDDEARFELGVRVNLALLVGASRGGW